MNDAFEYYDRKCVITSFRQASNFNENLMTVMYGAYFATSCYLGARGRTVLGTSARIFGCGYVFNSNLVRNGWDYYSLTEDIEFSAREFIKGTEIRYCDDAVFYIMGYALSAGLYIMNRKLYWAWFKPRI